MPERVFWLRDFRAGLVKDLPADSVPDDAITDGRNVVVKKGYIRKAEGYLAVLAFYDAIANDIGARILPGIPLLFEGVQFYDGTKHALACTTTDILRFDVL